MTKVLLSVLLLTFVCATTQAQGFDDEFSGSVDPRWEWIRPDVSRQLVLGSQLTIITQNGALYGTQYNNARNLLLQTAPQGSFAIETKVSFNADSTFHNAGLLYYLDDDNFVSVAKGVYLGEQVAMLTWEHDGAYVIRIVRIPVVSTLWLRLTARDYVHFTGEYSIDGIAWEHIDAVEIQFAGGTPRFGIKASNGEGVNVTRQQLPARFDFFHVNRNVAVHTLVEGPTSSMTLELYPMPIPSSSVAQLRVQAAQADDVELVLYSIGGRRIRSLGRMRVQPGMNIVSLPMLGLGPGSYVLSAVGQSGVGSQTGLLLR